VVPRVPSTYHRSYYSLRLLTTLAHNESNMPTTFILFMSSRIGMCDRLNSHILNYRLNSQWRQRHSGVIVNELNTVWHFPSFVSFNVPHLGALCMKKELQAFNFWHCTSCSKKCSICIALRGTWQHWHTPNQTCAQLLVYSINVH